MSVRSETTIGIQIKRVKCNICSCTFLVYFFFHGRYRSYQKLFLLVIKNSGIAQGIKNDNELHRLRSFLYGKFKEKESLGQECFNYRKEGSLMNSNKSLLKNRTL